MVKELGLNSFVVVNFWGEVINVPAATMLDSQVYNLSRSPPLWMNIQLNVDIGREGVCEEINRTERVD